MAATTRISDAFRPWPWPTNASSGSIGTWFGVRLPEGVVEVRDDHVDVLDYRRWVAWKTEDGEWHKMPYDAYPESIDAVIVAMKLTV